VARHTRSQTQGVRIAFFDPRTHRLTHWAEHDPPPQVPTNHSANSVLAHTTGTTPNYHQLLRGPEGHLWQQGTSNEIGRLAQGVLPHMPSGTDTIHYIRLVIWSSMFTLTPPISQSHNHAVEPVGISFSAPVPLTTPLP
jgi:hypothetical protein